jgi:integrase/recombinase XerD
MFTHYNIRQTMNISRRRGRAKTLSKEDLNRLIAYQKGDQRNGVRNICILWFSIGLGLRVAEIASITIGDVMNEASEIKESFSLKGKGEKYRTIYLVNKKVVDSLNNYLDYRREQGEDLNPKQSLFRTQRGSGFNSTTLQKLFKIMYRKCGLDEQLSSHSGRRSFCSNLINSGVGLKSVSVLMGHASIQTTVDIYCDHDEKILKNVCKNFKFI